MAVVDTAALLYWPAEQLTGCNVAYSQLKELEKLSPQRAMLVESISMNWHSPNTESAIEAATLTGDLPRLSLVDLEILAIAIDLNETLFTDDYSLQNVCRSCDLNFQSVSNRPSKELWKWELRCTGCRVSKKVEVAGNQVCDICGSLTILKRVR